MQGLCVFKAGVEWEVSATIPAATEAKHFCEVYLREDGAQNLRLQFAVPYHVVSSLSQQYHHQHIHNNPESLEKKKHASKLC